MSFGFSVLDIFTAIQLLVGVVEAYRDKGGPINQFAHEAAYLSSVQDKLRRMHTLLTQEKGLEFDAIGGLRGPISQLRDIIEKERPFLEQAAKDGTASHRETAARWCARVKWPLRTIMGKVKQLKKEIEQQLQMANTEMLLIILDNHTKKQNVLLSAKELQQIRDQVLETGATLSDFVAKAESLGCGGTNAQTLQFLQDMKKNIKSHKRALEVEMYLIAAEQEAAARERHEQTTSALGRLSLDQLETRNCVTSAIQETSSIHMDALRGVAEQGQRHSEAQIQATTRVGTAVSGLQQYASVHFDVQAKAAQEQIASTRRLSRDTQGYNQEQMDAHRQTQARLGRIDGGVRDTRASVVDMKEQGSLNHARQMDAHSKTHVEMEQSNMHLRNAHRAIKADFASVRRQAADNTHHVLTVGRNIQTSVRAGAAQLGQTNEKMKFLGLAMAGAAAMNVAGHREIRKKHEQHMIDHSSKAAEGLEDIKAHISEFQRQRDQSPLREEPMEPLTVVEEHEERRSEHSFRAEENMAVSRYRPSRAVTEPTPSAPSYGLPKSAADYASIGLRSAAQAGLSQVIKRADFGHHFGVAAHHHGKRSMPVRSGRYPRFAHQYARQMHHGQPMHVVGVPDDPDGIIPIDHEGVTSLPPPPIGECHVGNSLVPEDMVPGGGESSSYHNGHDLGRVREGPGEPNPAQDNSATQYSTTFPNSEGVQEDIVLRDTIANDAPPLGGIRRASEPTMEYELSHPSEPLVPQALSRRASDSFYSGRHVYQPWEPPDRIAESPTEEAAADDRVGVVHQTPLADPAQSRYHLWEGHRAERFVQQEPERRPSVSAADRYKPVGYADERDTESEDEHNNYTHRSRRRPTTWHPRQISDDGSGSDDEYVPRSRARPRRSRRYSGREESRHRTPTPPRRRHGDSSPDAKSPEYRRRRRSRNRSRSRSRSRSRDGHRRLNDSRSAESDDDGARHRRRHSYKPHREPSPRRSHHSSEEEVYDRAPPREGRRYRRRRHHSRDRSRDSYREVDEEYDNRNGYGDGYDMSVEDDGVGVLDVIGDDEAGHSVGGLFDATGDVFDSILSIF